MPIPKAKPKTEARKKETNTIWASPNDIKEEEKKIRQRLEEKPMGRKLLPFEIFHSNCLKIEKFLSEMKQNPDYEEFVSGYSLIRPEPESLLAFLMKGGTDIITLRIDTIHVNMKSDKLFQLMKSKKVLNFG